MKLKILAVAAVALLVFAVLAGCGGSSAPAGDTSSSPAPSAPAARTIGGTVTYAGSISPTHQIVVVAVLQGQEAPAYSTVLKKPGAYTFSGVADGTYAVIAFMDLGDDMGSPQPNEPQGVYDVNGDGNPDTVAVTGGQGVAGVDVTLRDR